MKQRRTILAMCLVFCQVPRLSAGTGRTAPDQEASSKPFMEHPTGEFTNATAAMEDAVARLRALQRWNDWITFRAQGMGSTENSYRSAEIRMQHNVLDVGPKPLALAGIVKFAGVNADALIQHGRVYSVAGASSKEVARLLDAIFRHHFGIQAFPNEGGDYSVGAEW